MYEVRDKENSCRVACLMKMQCKRVKGRTQVSESCIRVQVARWNSPMPQYQTHEHHLYKQWTQTLFARTSLHTVGR